MRVTYNDGACQGSSDELLGSYSITLQANAVASGGDTHEPNDSIGAATLIEVGETLAGAIDPQSDLDWYKFYL